MTPLDNTTVNGSGITSAAAFSQVYDTSRADHVSFQVTTSGASAASLTISQSNDGVTYLTISAQTVTISISSSLTSLLYVPADPKTKWTKITFTVTTGTAAISITDFQSSASLTTN